MSRCETRHGHLQCDKQKGHAGNCETKQGPRARAVPRAAATDPRIAIAMLARAGVRIALLEGALRKIKESPCDANGVGGASCNCCLHDRLIAADALKDRAS